MIKTVAAPSADVLSGSCRVSLGFTDGEGRDLGQSSIGLLRPGHAMRLDLAGASTSSEGNPLMAHQVVRVRPVVERALAAQVTCAVAVRLEVLDLTGRTMVVIEDPNLVTPDSIEQ